MSRPVAVVTGASAGIGAATSVRLAQEGFEVFLGARRLDKLKEVASLCDGHALALDVTNPRSIEEFSGAIESVNVLVNNAGLARGLEPMAEVSDENAQLMWETNVLGVMRLTRAFLPKLEASGAGHIVNVGYTSGFETYPRGGGYTATKHALRAVTRTLRLELLGRPIRVTEVSPGLVETEFSLVRFGGDRQKAKRPYEGIQPLAAEDVADCIAWAVTRPAHVNVDEIIVRPRAQATSMVIHRAESP
ncbi:MAG TPA: SDR family NAD(P)-dependent oxidoreductase [Actinomycetota bacterium]|nr:SDR family NAD(P)-dependent oxidoreductase [Actinomycetota bacterium]